MWAGGDGGSLDMLIEYAEAAEAHPPPLIGIGGAPGSGGNRGGGSSKVLGSDRRLEAIEAAQTARKAEGTDDAMPVTVLSGFLGAGKSIAAGPRTLATGNP